MRDRCRLIGWMVVDLIRSRIALEAEIWVLRQQINILRRTAPTTHAFSAIDRLIFVGLYRLSPNVRDALAIVKPDTIVRWHRAGIRSYWRWKSRRRGGRPAVSLEIRRLVRQMSIASLLWGTPSMASCSRLASRSARPVWPSIWRGGGPLRHKDGRRSFVTMLTVSRRWTFSWFRQSRSDCSMGC